MHVQSLAPAAAQKASASAQVFWPGHSSVHPPAVVHAQTDNSVVPRDVGSQPRSLQLLAEHAVWALACGNAGLESEKKTVAIHCQLRGAHRMNDHR